MTLPTMQKRFQARLEPVEISLPWVVVRLPFDPVKAWPNHVRLHVRGTIRSAIPASKSFSFATSLQSSEEHGYMLLVNKKMQKAAKLSLGELAEIVLEPDLEGAAATPPPELAKLLKADRGAMKWYEALSYSVRRYIAGDVSDSLSAEVRARRAELWMERILLVIEGEEIPPPVIQAAFRRQPQARDGWYRMTPNQRRMNLWGIVCCQSPEAQAKRVEKAIADAIRKASPLQNESDRQGSSDGPKSNPIRRKR